MAEGQRLSEKEINGFLDGPDKNNNGYIESEEVEHKLDEVHEGIAPESKPRHLHHEDRDEAAWHKFERAVMGTEQNHIPLKDFRQIIKKWEVTSINPEKKARDVHKAYIK